MKSGIFFPTETQRAQSNDPSAPPTALAPPACGWSRVNKEKASVVVSENLRRSMLQSFQGLRVLYQLKCFILNLSSSLLNRGFAACAFVVSALALTATLRAQTNTFPFPSSGNVGIGTTTPGAGLEISTATTPFKTTYSGGGAGVIGFGVSSSQTNALYLFGSTTYLGYGTGNFNIGTASSIGSAINPQFTILNSNGYVGIGTTNPLGQLDVAGVVRMDNGVSQANYFATLAARYDSSHPFTLTVENNMGGTAKEGVVVYSSLGGGYLNLALGLNGNVGVGTTNPSGMLSVSKSNGGNTSEAASAAIYIDQDESTIQGPGTYTQIRMGGNLGLDGTILTISNAGRAEKKRVNTGSNVGSRPTTTGYPLTVNGAVRAKEVIVDTGWSDYVFDDNYALAPLSDG